VTYTRADIAGLVHRALGALATDAALTTTDDGAGQTEGSYTDAIDYGLRAVGAIDADTDAIDVGLITVATLDDLLQVVKRAMLERLQLHYATVVDLQVGQREEKLSQIGAAIARLLGSSASGSARVTVRPLRRAARDYDFEDDGVS
jgi:hypothetical protein